jgi:hypothetical protein
MNGNFSPADLALHARLGIDLALLTRARVRRVTDREARDVLAINGARGGFDGIEYPYQDPTSGRRGTSRIRLDTPPRKPDGSPDKKYRSAYGDRQHLYFPPDARALLGQVEVPVVFVESEKAALALTALSARTKRPILAVALGGCWNFAGKTGTTTDPQGRRVPVKGPLPDFEKIALESRDVIVLFDARPNDLVKAARRQFAKVLRERHAVVRHAHLPDDNAAVNGPDDAVAVIGDAALWQIIDAAKGDEFTRHPTRGVILQNDLDNVRLALHRLGVTPRYDEFAQQVLIDGVPLDDAGVNALWIAIDDTFHFRPATEMLLALLTNEAQRRCFHPVRDYLNGLTWDGKARLDQWLMKYAGACDSKYVRAVSSLPLIAAVRRVRHPGVKFDELLILESGSQGTGKSSALRALCPNESWFSDDLPLGVDSKQVIERTNARWIVEASELNGHRGREAETLKAFLSRQADGPVRLAYGRLPTTVARQFIIIGSTNSANYLKDMTGARRFWPVTITRFDVDELTRDRDQIWAEASAREATGASIRLDPALWADAAEQQEDRRAGDPWEDVLEPLFVGRGLVVVDSVPVATVWSALGLQASHLNNSHADRVASIAARYGFVKGRKPGEDRTRCWVRELDEVAP